jgi:Flp pilus assembly pilin Flp
MNRVYQLWLRYGSRLKPGQPGQTMAEYGLILALVAIVAIGAWAVLGTNVSTIINSIAGNL